MESMSEDVLRTEIIIETEGEGKVEKRFMEEWLSDELESLLDIAETLRQRALGLERDKARLTAEKEVLTRELQKVNGGAVVKFEDEELVKTRVALSEVQQKYEASQLRVQELKTTPAENSMIAKPKYVENSAGDLQRASSQRALAKAESFRKMVSSGSGVIPAESLTDGTECTQDTEFEELQSNIEALEAVKQQTEEECERIQDELIELQEKRGSLLGYDTDALLKRCEAAEQARDELAKQLEEVHKEIVGTSDIFGDLTARMSELMDENSRLKNELMILCKALNRKDDQLVRATADVRSLKTCLKSVSEEVDYHRENKNKDHHPADTLNDFMHAI
mmetsp:Transcript_8264/g.24844  ORF Transcript_8264/g.24844 Transcript_8264/m.24844 type:complete len:336 (-) Transcript_8264:152-1159(-)